jgi:hypothetical protein
MGKGTRRAYLPSGGARHGLRCHSEEIVGRDLAARRQQDARHALSVGQAFAGKVPPHRFRRDIDPRRELAVIERCIFKILGEGHNPILVLSAGVCQHQFRWWR